jgi:hypothetical protein
VALSGASWVCCCTKSTQFVAASILDSHLGQVPLEHGHIAHHSRMPDKVSTASVNFSPTPRKTAVRRILVELSGLMSVEETMGPMRMLCHSSIDLALSRPSDPHVQHDIILIDVIGNSR